VHAEQIVPDNRNGKLNAQWFSSLEHYAESGFATPGADRSNIQFRLVITR
jgi:hypothetical protein